MRAMTAIPAGETRTYGEIASDLESAPIAVGQACGRNPIPVIVPCHRIVGVDSLVGYGGGLELKRQLLEHEGQRFRASRRHSPLAVAVSTGESRRAAELVYSSH